MSDEAAAGDAPADDDDGNWAERRLCPDGGCVGVVGARGVCGVCGKVDPGFDAAMAARAAAGAHEGGEEGEERDDDDEADDDGDGDGDADADGAGDDDQARPAPPLRGEGGDEWEERKLCEDGACIGVVIDGRCNTCGRAG